MGEKELLRRMLRIATRETERDTPRADSILAWCSENQRFLGLSDPTKKCRFVKKGAIKKNARRKKRKGRSTPWNRLCAALEKMRIADESLNASVVMAARLAAILKLSASETRLLLVVVALDRQGRPNMLLRRLRAHGLDPLLLYAGLAELDGAETIANSAPSRLGLIEIRSDRSGELTIETSPALDRALQSAPIGAGDLVESLIGSRARATLKLADFTEHTQRIDIIRRLLLGALKNGTAGINVLLHGPPGTGKTELAKSLASAASAALFAVGESDEYGEEPNRWDRVTALRLAQRVLTGRSDALLLFDEMEDLIGDVQRAAGSSGFSRREGSKVFVNRLLETNPVPTLWTSNDIENVDPAFLRRMSYVLEMDLPSPATRKRIFSRVAEATGVALSDGAIDRLADTAPEAVTVAHSTLRTANLAGGDEAETGMVMDALVRGIRHGRPAPPAGSGPKRLDLDLYQSRTPIREFSDSLSGPGAPLDVSILLMGPPGTGKTALAHHVAMTLDRPLVVKRASDLLSKYIGETEKLIAEAFAKAAEQGHVLLFDEIDSLLFDRATANRSWEVSQVNELLTWMDQHPMPFVAATNHAGRLDPAAMRRFDFKLELEPLSSAKATHAFRLFFDREPPASLQRLDNLTPGDFSTVARQLRFQKALPPSAEILALLEREIAAKPCRLGRIGF